MKPLVVLFLLIATGGALSARAGANATREELPRPHPAPSAPGLKHGNTWKGIFLGFSKLQGSNWKDYTGEMEVDWSRSFALHVNFDDYILARNATGRNRLVSGYGLEYTRYCFDRDITIRRYANGNISLVPLADLNVTDPRRSVFKTLYLTVPLLAEFQSAGGRFSLALGVVGGARLHSKTKIVHDDHGKRKIKKTGSYTMYPFKADVTARARIGFLTVWATRSLTPLFNPRKAPARVYPFTIGFGFTPRM
ncbi:MAG: hypothetical protein LBP56_08050 [Odoribacteraceae bacterium]|jgi:hypothetical protein|nr:hypothetical protein [Odoribacteraceae bacterium]